MGHHDYEEYDDDEDEHREHHRGHHDKRKRRLWLFGCGCITIVLVTIVLGLAGMLAGVQKWLMPAVSSVTARLPKGIPLPAEVRQSLPPGVLKLTPQEQIRLGQEVAQQEGLDQSAFTDAAVDAVATRLTNALPPQYRGPQGSGWAWQFQGIRTQEGLVNAMALPGGRVYIYDGLLKLTGGDQDQLALVMGHEMGHVVEEHTAEQLRTAGLLQSAVDLVGSNGEGGQSEGQLSDAMRALATRLGKQIVSMQLSQSAEYQADALGLQFMRDAGYDPKKGLLILERMDQLAQSRGAESPVIGRVFSTHPPMQTRIQRLREKLATNGKP